MGNCQYQRTKKAIFTDSKSIVDLLQNDQKKFDNNFPEEFFFPVKFANYFLDEKKCFQLKEKEAHRSGFHHSRFSATAIFPGLPKHEVDTGPSILIRIMAP